MVARDPGGEDLARPFSFLAGFFFVSLDGLSELRGTTRSLGVSLRANVPIRSS